MYICKALIAAALLLPTFVLAQEKKIQRADLPAPVEKALAAQTQGATIKGFSREKENGQTYYEAEMTVGRPPQRRFLRCHWRGGRSGRAGRIRCAPGCGETGTPVQSGQGKLVKVESITKHDKLVAYKHRCKQREKSQRFRSAPTASRSTTRSEGNPAFLPVLELF